MNLLLDGWISLTWLRFVHGANHAAIRRVLQSQGYSFEDANAYGCVAVFGFTTPDGHRFLTQSQRRRLDLIELPVAIEHDFALN